MLISTREGGGPLTELELKRLESELRIRLPADYRRFLLRFNGGRPEPAGFDLESDGEAVPWLLHLFFSVNDAIESCRIGWNYQVTRETRPSDVVPIATDPFGNLLYLGIKSGALEGVHFGATPSNGEQVHLLRLAESFDAFLAKLH